MNDVYAKSSNKKGKTDDIDKVVGQRLKARRILLGLSQQDLGDAVNVSVQQIQKYEKATNRISCGKLYSMSKLLKTPITYFFDQSKNVTSAFVLAEDQEEFDTEHNADVVLEKEFISLIRFYKCIKDSVIRRKILDLVKTVSENKISM